MCEINSRSVERHRSAEQRVLDCSQRKWSRGGSLGHVLKNQEDPSGGIWQANNPGECASLQMLEYAYLNRKKFLGGILPHAGLHLLRPLLLSFVHSCVCVSQLCLTLCDPMVYLWSSLATNTRVGFHSLCQGIFQTQGSNPGLLQCRQILSELPGKSHSQLYFCFSIGCRIILWPIVVVMEWGMGLLTCIIAIIFICVHFFLFTRSGFWWIQSQ